MELYDVVTKLIGSIDPIADSSIDAYRYKNLEEQINLVDKLIQDIYKVSSSSNRHEESVKKIGQRAKEYLKELVESLEFDD